MSIQISHFFTSAALLARTMVLLGVWTSTFQIFESVQGATTSGREASASLLRADLFPESAPPPNQGTPPQNRPVSMLSTAASSFSHHDHFTTGRAEGLLLSPVEAEIKVDVPATEIDLSTSDDRLLTLGKPIFRRPGTMQRTELQERRQARLPFGYRDILETYDSVPVEVENTGAGLPAWLFREGTFYKQSGGAFDLPDDFFKSTSSQSSSVIASNEQKRSFSVGPAAVGGENCSGGPLSSRSVSCPPEQASRVVEGGLGMGRPQQNGASSSGDTSQPPPQGDALASNPKNMQFLDGLAHVVAWRFTFDRQTGRPVVLFSNGFPETDAYKLYVKSQGKDRRFAGTAGLKGEYMFNPNVNFQRCESGLIAPCLIEAPLQTRMVCMDPETLQTKDVAGRSRDFNLLLQSARDWTAQGRAEADRCEQVVPPIDNFPHDRVDPVGRSQSSSILVAEEVSRATDQQPATYRISSAPLLQRQRDIIASWEQPNRELLRTETNSLRQLRTNASRPDEPCVETASANAGLSRAWCLLRLIGIRPRERDPEQHRQQQVRAAAKQGKYAKDLVFLASHQLEVASRRNYHGGFYFRPGKECQMGYRVYRLCHDEPETVTTFTDHNGVPQPPENHRANRHTTSSNRCCQVLADDVLCRVRFKDLWRGQVPPANCPCMMHTTIETENFVVLAETSLRWRPHATLRNKAAGLAPFNMLKRWKTPFFEQFGFEESLPLAFRIYQKNQVDGTVKFVRRVVADHPGHIFHVANAYEERRDSDLKQRIVIDADFLDGWAFGPGPDVHEQAMVRFEIEFTPMPSSEAGFSSSTEGSVSGEVYSGAPSAASSTTPTPGQWFGSYFAAPYNRSNDTGTPGFASPLLGFGGGPAGLLAGAASASSRSSGSFPLLRGTNNGGTTTTGARPRGSSSSSSAAAGGGPVLPQSPTPSPVPPGSSTTGAGAGPQPGQHQPGSPPPPRSFMSSHPSFFITDRVQKKTILTDSPGFPVINPAFLRKKHRYVFAVTDSEFSSISQIDTLAQTTTVWRLARGNDHRWQVSEPQLVCRYTQALPEVELDGVLLVPANDMTEEVSYLLAFDPRTMQELARIRSKVDVNYGLHSQYIGPEPVDELPLKF
ncbi:unnamed protein product [Amoebophrya sp. A120]|nr:unnamed protein product [Amoebophrya sp. A120]|eukprot:GSA120T00005651001.1